MFNRGSRYRVLIIIFFFLLKKYILKGASITDRYVLVGPVNSAKILPKLAPIEDAEETALNKTVGPTKF